MTKDRLKKPQNQAKLQKSSIPNWICPRAEPVEWFIFQEKKWTLDDVLSYCAGHNKREVVEFIQDVFDFSWVSQIKLNGQSKSVSKRFTKGDLEEFCKKGFEDVAVKANITQYPELSLQEMEKQVEVEVEESQVEVEVEESQVEVEESHDDSTTNQSKKNEENIGDFVQEQAESNASQLDKSPSIESQQANLESVAEKLCDLSLSETKVLGDEFVTVSNSHNIYIPPALPEELSKQLSLSGCLSCFTRQEELQLITGLYFQSYILFV